ncbi:hypothetical protein H632_c1071p0 [Helicosporidium sp. ATCC 50920]|nr:hypothetical protein H632_c1071p0 [Helicosporidium sp. ATCC 50920]|eukprot:KDD74791.1 hypothetical protein H632_c1071p0 [Helicosporidium sp. ATCC 50920]
MVVSSGSASGGGGSGVRLAAAVTNASSPRQTSLSRNAPSSFLTSRRGSWVSEGLGPQSLAALSASQASAKSSWRLRLAGREGQELSRVLGGGVVPGSVVLVGGEPGVGKSTLLLQLADMLCSIESEAGNGADGEDDGQGEAAPCVLYVSGEESAEQVADRATRLGLIRPDRVLVHCATRLESILEALVDARPRAVVLDSIQTVYLEDVPSSAGSVTQVRECATALLHVAKRLGVPLFLAGHVNKAGDIAGPRVLEHIVDVVLYLEGGGGSAMRMLRGIKNRYGTTDEVGLFQMEEEGLVAIEDPSAIFMASRSVGVGCISFVGAFSLR